jgi:hypothetical protein
MGTWRDYIGLPHEIGADPRDGIAADCLLLVFAVQDELGIPHPEPDERWFEAARNDQIQMLCDEFFDGTEVVDEVSDGCFTLLTVGLQKIGFAIRIEGGALTVNEKRGGVIWIPDCLKGWEYFYRWKL